MSNPFHEYAASRPDVHTSGLIPQHIVDQIRDVLPPSAVISKHVQLRKAGRELRGLSPFNKERTPSFFVNDAKRFWHCFSSNQSGDIYGFLVKVEGVSFPDAVRSCAGMAGIAIPDSRPDAAAAPCSARSTTQSAEAMACGAALAQAAAEREARQRAELAEEAERERKMANLAKAIARDSRAFAIGDGSPPALFLVKRGLHMPAEMSPRALLYHPACPYRDDDDNEVRHPSLIGIYRTINTDQVMAISRRPLTRDGRSVSDPRSLGPTHGCVIKLTADEDVCEGLHLAEGITSALAAAMLGMTPIWATGGAGTMAKFPVLGGVDSLTLIADNDKNGAGQAAANECLARWQNAGREAWIVVPDTPGTDMADVVRGRYGG